LTSPGPQARIEREIKGERASMAFLRAFALSVLAGGGMAAAVPLLWWLSLGLAAGAWTWADLPSVTGVALYILGVSTIVVLAFCLVVGLPTVTALRLARRESAAAYVTLAAAIGAVAPLALLYATRTPSGYWLALIGAASGGVTGYTWWRSSRVRPRGRASRPSDGRRQRAASP
jgi:hypothetical protein